MIKNGEVVKNVMRRFRMDEISMVDRPAQDGARVAIMKRDDDLQKRLAMTTMAAGHAHLIVGLSGGDGGISDVRAGKTSYQDGHQHDWMMDDAGNIIVGDAMGHVHGIAAYVTKGDEIVENYWKRDFTAEERKRLAQSGAAMKDGSFPIRNATDLKNALQAFGRAGDRAAVARHIKSRARALGLTDQLPKEGRLADLLKKGMDAASEAGDSGEEKMDDDTKNAVTAEELEALQKRAERAEKLAELSDAQKTYLKGLGAEDQERFLALDEGGRQAAVKKADEANSVEWTDPDTGEEFRKNDDPRLITLAKRSYEDRKQRREAEERERTAELEKLAAELTSLPGEDKVRKAVIKSILALPAEERDAALTGLRAQNATLSKRAFTSLGARGATEETGSPEAEINKIAKNLREKDPTLTEAQAMVKAMETPAGQELYAKHVGRED